MQPRPTKYEWKLIDMFHLLDLPQELHILIIRQLTPGAGSSLFIPTSVADEGPSNFARKTKECYGSQTSDQVQRSESLLNLSLTCRYLRELVLPELLKTVILRTKKKSVRSIDSLLRGQNRSHIKHFVFQGTDEDATGVEWEMSELRTIFSLLPRDLSSLTLDFPQGWRGSYGSQGFDTFFDGDDYFEDDQGLAMEEDDCDRYRSLLFTVMNSSSDFVISSQLGFELNLYNIPPMICSVYKSSQFQSWLRHCEKFRMILAHGATIDMNPSGHSTKFAGKLGEWFFNHLDNVQMFHLYADQTWPLGHLPTAENMCKPLPLPKTMQSLAKVKHVSLKDIFICASLTDFFVARSKQLTSIELIDCYANGHDARMPSPTWADFFGTMMEANFAALTCFNVRSEQETVRNAGSITVEDEVMVVVTIARQREAEATRSERWMFRYCYLGSHLDGFLYDRASLMAKRFVGGEDYDAYIRFVDVLDANRLAEMSIG